MDHYSTLGVAKNATPDEIKKAYRSLASKHHPDKGGDTATFQKIQVAYETLSDPQKREEYENPRPQFHPGQGGFQFRPGGGGFPPGMEDIISQMFRQGRGNQQQAPTFRTTVWITLETAFSGGGQTLRLQTQKGASMVEIKIPKGIQNGGQVKFEKALDGADLIAEFRIHDHLKFERHGNDLACVLPISILALVTGVKLPFETLSGKTLEVTIPPKTQPYFQMRLAGYGMPVGNVPGVFGDQILVLKPFMPTDIPESVIQSIQAYQTSSI